MYIGIILGYFEDKKRGELIIVGRYAAEEKTEFNYIFCEFSLSECQTIVHEWKVVIVNQIKEIDRRERLSHVYFAENCTHIAIGITDEFPKLRKDYFYFEVNEKIGDFLLGRVPYLNPMLFHFFINNDLYDSSNELSHILDERPGEIITYIKRTKELISRLDNFSVEEAIDSYEVNISEHAISRPGKDDIASISIVGKRSYWSTKDLYLEKVLPQFSRTIARDSAWCPADRLLSDLWSEIGGEEKRKVLEQECLEIRRKNISKFRKTYSRKTHEYTLRKSIIKKERDLRIKMENSLRKVAFY